ncbi:MAG: right-handed parallel beta-helix repeat-containing protein, partial [Candidatus Micrarchaeota archaeon]
REIASAVFDEQYSNGRVDSSCIKFSANVSTSATPTSAKKNETNFFVYWGNADAQAPFYKPDADLTAVSKGFNVDEFYVRNSLVEVGIDRSERSGSVSEGIVEFRKRVPQIGKVFALCWDNNIKPWWENPDKTLAFGDKVDAISAWQYRNTTFDMVDGTTAVLNYSYECYANYPVCELLVFVNESHDFGGLTSSFSHNNLASVYNASKDLFEYKSSTKYALQNGSSAHRAPSGQSNLSFIINQIESSSGKGWDWNIGFYHGDQWQSGCYDQGMNCYPLGIYETSQWFGFTDGDYYQNYTQEMRAYSHPLNVTQKPFNNTPPELPPLNLTSCRVLNQSGILTKNVTASGTCFTINASNIFLDCANHSITGKGSGNGVYNNGFDNVEVKNCDISNFSRGIAFQSYSNDAKIHDNSVHHNKLDGIRILTSEKAVVYYNRAFRNDLDKAWTYGIYLATRVNDSQVYGNTVFENMMYGIVLAGGNNNVFHSNLVFNNSLNSTGSWEVLFTGGSYQMLNNSFTNNTVSSGKYGFATVKADGLVFEGNNVTTRLRSLQLEWSNNSVVKQNYLLSTGDSAMRFLQSHNSTVSDNRAEARKYHPLLIETNSSGFSVFSNTLVSTNSTGVVVRGNSWNASVKNNAINAKTMGIYLDSGGNHVVCGNAIAAGSYVFAIVKGVNNSFDDYCPSGE